MSTLGSNRSAFAWERWIGQGYRAPLYASAYWRAEGSEAEAPCLTQGRKGGWITPGKGVPSPGPVVLRSIVGVLSHVGDAWARFFAEESP